MDRALLNFGLIRWHLNVPLVFDRLRAIENQGPRVMITGRQSAPKVRKDVVHAVAFLHSVPFNLRFVAERCCKLRLRWDPGCSQIVAIATKFYLSMSL